MILHERGRLAWVSENMPRKVTVNGTDVTDRVQRTGMLNVISLEEESGSSCCLY